MGKYNEKESYPVKENKYGYILIVKKSNSYLSGYTLNQLILKGIKVINKSA